jgi:nitrate/nitrite transporter NarK
MLRNPVVAAVTVSYFMVNTSIYGLALWLPKIVQKIFVVGSLQVSLIVAVPYLIAAPAMFLSGWHSDKTRERRWHAAFAAAMAGAGLALSQIFDGAPILALAALTIAAIGILAYYPPMWALPTQVLSERTAAANFGLINLIANLGGFLGPYAVGFLTDRTGTYAAGMYFLVATAFIGAVVIACVRPQSHRTTLRAFATEAYRCSLKRISAQQICRPAQAHQR